MKVYLVLDSKTGRIVHTHASYVLGNDEPVATSEEEVLTLAPSSGPEDAYRVIEAPADFDVHSRVQKLKIDSGTGAIRVTTRKRPRPERGSGS